MVYTLLAAKARKECAYCVFAGHVLHSDNVTMDSAYMEVKGCTKAEYDKTLKELHKQYWKEKRERKLREERYHEKVEASRDGSPKTITADLVINGLKFIAEHQSLSQEDLIDGLLELGCTFSSDDIMQQFPTFMKFFDGIKQDDISCGASIIVSVRDSEFSRTFCNEHLLGVDNDTSIYHFIRLLTGDRMYTKEFVDMLNEIYKIKK